MAVVTSAANSAAAAVAHRRSFGLAGQGGLRLPLGSDGAMLEHVRL